MTSGRHDLQLQKEVILLHAFNYELFYRSWTSSGSRPDMHLQKGVTLLHALNYEFQMRDANYYRNMSYKYQI